jgi:hypothetical protein
LREFNLYLCKQAGKQNAIDHTFNKIKNGQTADVSLSTRQSKHKVNDSINGGKNSKMLEATNNVLTGAPNKEPCIRQFQVCKR